MVVKAFGIDVNTVRPSGADMRLIHDSGRSTGRTSPSTPGDIANVIAFLAGLESSAVTGMLIDTYGLGNPLFGRTIAADRKEHA